MGAEGAVNILHRKEVAADSADPEAARTAPERRTIPRESSPIPYQLRLAEGYIDTVIEPSQTRAALINALQMLANKRETNPPKKHGTMPL